MSYTTLDSVCILIAECNGQTMSPGFCFGCDRQQQVGRGAGRCLGGSLDLAAFQLQPIADLEQELQHQAAGDQCCSGMQAVQHKSSTYCPHARLQSLSAHAVERPAMSDSKAHILFLRKLYYSSHCTSSTVAVVLDTVKACHDSRFVN